MNLLQRFYEALAYRLTKWWFTRKYRSFLSKRHFNAVMQYYDAIYKEA